VSKVAGSANQATSPSTAPLPPATGNGGMAASGGRANVLVSVLGLFVAASLAAGTRLLGIAPRR
jgi:ABC-type xylose transport system permease subunit